MSFDPRSFPVDSRTSADLAAKGLEYRLVDADDDVGIDGWIEADHCDAATAERIAEGIARGNALRIYPLP